MLPAGKGCRFSRLHQAGKIHPVVASALAAPHGAALPTDQPEAQMDDDFRKAALDYHRLPRPGKLAIEPTKRMATQRDLALAYSPGVAAACEEIAANPVAAY